MKPPYIKLYVKDFAFEIQGMTKKQIGEYVLKFLNAYRHESVPDELSTHSIFSELKISLENYGEKCEKNKKNIEKRYSKKNNDIPLESDTCGYQSNENGKPVEYLTNNQEPITINQELLKKKSIKKKAESTALVCKTITPVSFRSAPIKSTTLEPHYRDDQEFMAFWEMYPRKRRGDPHAAYKTWQELIISGEVSTEAIMQGCHQYANSREGSGQYAQGCQRWLNDYGWMKNYTTHGDPHAKFNPVQTIINLRDTGGELKEGIDYTVICGERVLNY